MTSSTMIRKTTLLSSNVNTDGPGRQLCDDGGGGVCSPGLHDTCVCVSRQKRIHAETFTQYENDCVNTNDFFFFFDKLPLCSRPGHLS